MNPSSVSSIKVDESILGYKLKERIGAGGYGEVWVAEAPGGLAKAAKIVYGFLDEKRAQRELRALDHIKQVRHPFLLSLDRIDIVEGRLVVISELADKSLKDRFDECCLEGEPGIPRDELLAYLRDAADALDYMVETYSLQHLDIKPENLLLVGSHVKVGDFGLVKDIQSANQSLIEGLTPAYASPELFDGHPNRNSDQYSLAIVFQEMLTGRRPFSGTNASQLATQHLHCRPDLHSLAPNDQTVISRALSKDPERRFPNCSAMVDELSRRRRRTSSATPGPATIAADKPEPIQRDVTQVLADAVVQRARVDAEVRQAPRLDLDPQEAGIRPTLFVGVGHGATQILTKLRRRFRDCHGPLDNFPAVRFLCLDSNRRALTESTVSSGSDSLSDYETFALPLRKPEEYRRDQNLDLSWLSRRWVFNVPRNLQTEGLRPLGRLAFVDNFEGLFVRLQELVGKITAPEALATTAEHLGLDPIAKPQVMIVASISGGIGSGMVLDLAYAIRTVLAEAGLPDDTVMGMLTHGTIRGTGDDRLAVANAYSFMSEYRHYALYGYPGAESCGLPEFDDSRPPLSPAYLVDLGADLQPSELDVAQEKIAEYLYLSTATPCSAFFFASRSQSQTDPSNLRAMGISCTGQGPGLALNPTMKVAQRLIQRWQGSFPDIPADFPSSRYIRMAMEQAGLVAANIFQLVENQLRDIWGRDPLHHIQRLVASVNFEQLDAQPLVRGEHLPAISKMLDQALDCGPTSATGNESNLAARMAQLGEPLVVSLTQEISHAVFGLINEPGARIAAAKAAVKAVRQALHSLLGQVEDQRSNFACQLATINQRFTQAAKVRRGRADDARSDAVGLTNQYVLGRLQLTIAAMARKLVTGVIDRFADNLRVLTHFDQQLGLVAQQFTPAEEPAPARHEPNTVIDVGRLIGESLDGRIDQLADRAEAMLQNDFFQHSHGLLGVLQNGGCWLRKLTDAAYTCTKMVVTDAMKETDLDDLIQNAGFAPADIMKWVQNQGNAAEPSFASSGGTRQLLSAVPSRGPTTHLSELYETHFLQQANVIAATSGDFVVCYEVSNIPLVNAAIQLIEQQPGSAELIPRLHSRNDVRWTNLTAIG